MEELIISDAELSLLSQILKSASPRPLSEEAIEIKPSFSQVSKLFQRPISKFRDKKINCTVNVSKRKEAL